MNPSIIFRADGNTQMGLGHISRCCAIAQMLKEDYQCLFIIKDPLPFSVVEIANSGAVLHRLGENMNTTAEARTISQLISQNDIVVLDGYAFTTKYQQVLKETGCSLVCIDDLHNYHFVADAIINHAGGVVPSTYSKEFYSQTYLGPAYAMLRSPFWPGEREKIKTGANEVLILLGGADPGNATLDVLKTCFEKTPTANFHVVLGGAYIHEEALQFFLSQQPDKRVSVYRNIPADEIAGLMKRSAVAITPPSTVAYEYLFTGGCLYLHPIAENQQDMYQYFIANKLARKFSEYPEGGNANSTCEVRMEYDFKKNIRKIFSGLVEEKRLSIKKASGNDADILFKWRNDPEVRNQSYQSSPISWQDHLSWFNEKVADPGCHIYILYRDEQPAGQIRFDIDNRHATISYLVASDQRGQGLGNLILKKGILALLAEREGVKEITGFVRKNNTASSKSFRKMGFQEEETEEYPDSYKYSLRWEK